LSKNDVKLLASCSASRIEPHAIAACSGCDEIINSMTPKYGARLSLKDLILEMKRRPRMRSFAMTSSSCALLSKSSADEHFLKRELSSGASVSRISFAQLRTR
jgi:hypothetical protein